MIDGGVISATSTQAKAAFSVSRAKNGVRIYFVGRNPTKIVAEAVVTAIIRLTGKPFVGVRVVIEYRI